MAAAAPEDLTSDELRAVAATVEAAAARFAANASVSVSEASRAHYVWLLRNMLANLAPDDMTTQTLVSLVSCSGHPQRVVGGAPRKGNPRRARDAVLLSLVPRPPA